MSEERRARRQPTPETQYLYHPLSPASEPAGKVAQGARAGIVIDGSERRLWVRLEPLARDRGRSIVSTDREWLHRVVLGHSRIARPVMLMLEKRTFTHRRRGGSGGGYSSGSPAFRRPARKTDSKRSWSAGVFNSPLALMRAIVEYLSDAVSLIASASRARASCSSPLRP
jgi:hypothetical protein